MRKRFEYTSYTAHLSSINDVVCHMQSLDQELTNTTLENLKAFNTTYLIITQSVVEKCHQNFFTNDQRMEQFDILFAKYYFDALHNYVHNKPCAPAWRLLFDACQQNKLTQWQYMALGVNAHVNNDLALALFDFHPGPDYYIDYQKVNVVLSEQVNSVINSLNDRGFIRTLYRPKVSALYSPILLFIIFWWRKSAWQNYQKLLQKAHYRETIMKKAAHIARLFGAH